MGVSMPPGLCPSLRTLLAAFAALLVTLGLLAVTTAAPAQAASNSMTALILGSSVSPYTATDAGAPDNNPESLEQQQAEADGYKVTVVDDATWLGMTQAQFASYQLIILGDPASCGVDTVGGPATNPPNGSVAYQNASTWEPAVMSSGGNKVLIGTDPTFQYAIHGTAPQAPTLERNSLAYAGAVSGATGLYLDLGCSYDTAPAGTAVPILDGLSTDGAGQFAVQGWNSPSGSACATAVNIVASTGPTSGLTDGNLSNWNCSVHEAFTSFPSDYTPMAIAPSTSGFPSVYCAKDVTTNSQACGSPYMLLSGGGVSVSSNISLTPDTQTHPTSTITSTNSATLTATVMNGSTPVSGQSVTFNINTGPDAPASYTTTTDSNGQATYTFNSGGVSGTDDISASFKDTSGNIQKALANVIWKGPVNGDDFVKVTSSNPSLTGSEGAPLSSQTLATFVDTDQDDPNNTSWNVSVDWGDGTAPWTGHPNGSSSSFSVPANHTYAEPGKYTVTITITDASNTANSATATATETISEGQLSVTTTSPSPTEGSAFSGQVATFTDTDLSAPASNYTATVDWGDGSSSSTGTVTAVSGTPGSFTVSANHTYADAGSDPVKVTVTEVDASSSTASGQANATVAEAPIVVSTGSIAPTAAAAFSGQVATFTDGDPLTPAGDYSASINWGDGTTTSGTVSGSSGSFTVTGGHTYATVGSFPLTVSVHETDDPGATGSGAGSAVTTGAPLTVFGMGTIVLPSHVFNRQVARFTDGNTAAAAGSFHARITWGDGATSAGAISGSGGSFTVAAVHTFPSGPGPYTVRITVTDAANVTASAATTVLIPSSSATVSIPSRVSASTLLCGVKRHSKCKGLDIRSMFPGSGRASWKISMSKSGKGSVTLGKLSSSVSAGARVTVFKVSSKSAVKRLYKLLKRHRLSTLTVQQTFTNVTGASGIASASAHLSA